MERSFSARWNECQQIGYTSPPVEVSNGSAALLAPTPELLPNLLSVRLRDRALRLPTKLPITGANFRKGSFGQLRQSDGTVVLFNPEFLLIKFRADRHVTALRVEQGQELNAARLIAGRSDVEFVEFDVFQERQFVPSDPQLAGQWHHSVLGSFRAWDRTLGRSSIRVAIADTPFQMNHPDLMQNVTSGWDVIDDQPVTASAGIAHSTLCAGLVAAVVDNGVGVAGLSNCQILPININGAISEMYNAIIWAADHGVRIVNLSWTGGNSDVLNTAAEYLRSKTSGIVAMPGVNGAGFLDYTNQPYILCVSMTDAAGNMRSHFGDHIDFAAPGWDVLSTTINGGYTGGTGTSYATPLLCGALAGVLSINPTLSASEAINILKETAIDEGPPGWDPYFGWGRIDFGTAVTAAWATLPVIEGITRTNGAVIVRATFRRGPVYRLWRALDLKSSAWSAIAPLTSVINGNSIELRDGAPPPGVVFYRVSIEVP